MTTTLLIAIISTSVLQVALLLQSVAFPQIRVWPLPADDGYALRARKIVSHAIGVSTGVLSLGVVLLAVVDRHSLQSDIPGLGITGLAVAIAGGIFGLSGYLTLGPVRSSGQPGPLVSRGPYQISRNPQYVGAIALLLGLSAAFSSGPALLGAAACSSWFLLAPIAEEHWLREQLGAEFDAYIETAPRYLGWRARHARAG